MFGRLSFFKKRPSDSRGVIPREDEHKYCPLCGDEYRAVIKRCAACDIELITAEQKQTITEASATKRTKSSLQITADDELVTIRKGILLEMKNIQRLLEKELIGSVLIGDGADCGKSCCGSSNFELKVKSVDGDEAMTVLAKDFRQATALDSHDFGDKIVAVFDQRAATTSCPACGSSFVPEDRTCPECGLCF